VGEGLSAGDFRRASGKLGNCAGDRTHEFIASIGELYGQVLAASRNPDPGLEVREETAATFEKLKRSEDAPRVRAVQEQIRAARGKDSVNEERCPI
jgi:hypothetical protein